MRQGPEVAGAPAATSPPASGTRRGEAVRGKELGSAPGAEGQGTSWALCAPPPFFSRVRVRAHPCTFSSLPPGLGGSARRPGSFSTPDPSFPLLLCYPSKIFLSGLRCRCPDDLGSLRSPQPHCLLPSNSFGFVPPKPSLPRNLLTWEASLLAPESGAHSFLEAFNSSLDAFISECLGFFGLITVD